MFTSIRAWRQVLPEVVSSFSLRVGVVLLFVVVGAILYAHTSPVARAAHDLALCDGVPCFRGVIPGVTSWEQAMRQFNDRVVFQIDPPEAEIRLFPSKGGDKVGRIIVQLASTDSLTAGEVVALFGDPCRVEHAATAETVTLIYPHLMAKVTLSNGRLKLHSSVRYLWLHSEERVEECNGSNPNATTIYADWRGFGKRSNAQ